MKAVAKTVEPAEREARFDHIRPLYHEALTLVERLHRRLLDVIKDEFDRRGRADINSVQALLLYNIGDKELTAGELRTRGYYLGSNVSYNLKKLVEMAFLDHQRSRVDRRSVRIKLTDKGREVRDIVESLYQKHVRTVEQVGGINADEFATLNKSLHRLERFWTDQNSLSPVILQVLVRRLAPASQRPGFFVLGADLSTATRRLCPRTPSCPKTRPAAQKPGASMNRLWPINWLREPMPFVVGLHSRFQTKLLCASKWPIGDHRPRPRRVRHNYRYISAFKRCFDFRKLVQRYLPSVVNSKSVILPPRIDKSARIFAAAIQRFLPDDCQPRFKLQFANSYGNSNSFQGNKIIVGDCERNRKWF